jgi:hypothetical protein
MIYYCSFAFGKALLLFAYPLIASYRQIKYMPDYAIVFEDIDSVLAMFFNVK